MNTTQRKELFTVNAKCTVIMTEVSIDHLNRELIASGRNRRMNRKDMTGLSHLKRFVKGEIMLVFEFPHPFQRHKGRVALVHVANRWLQT